MTGDFLLLNDAFETAHEPSLPAQDIQALLNVLGLQNAVYHSFEPPIPVLATTANSGMLTLPTIGESHAHISPIAVPSSPVEARVFVEPTRADPNGTVPLEPMPKETKERSGSSTSLAKVFEVLNGRQALCRPATRSLRDVFRREEPVTGGRGR